MRFPNKITSLSESVIGKGAIVLRIISKQDLSIIDLYKRIKRSFVSFSEYVDTLDYLFAINKIVLNDKGDLLHYVE